MMLKNFESNQLKVVLNHSKFTNIQKQCFINHFISKN